MNQKYSTSGSELSRNAEAPLSVVIPSEPGNRPDGSIAALARLLPRAEVLVAYGHQPSRQRNEAVRQAKGELIWFLDSDAIPQPGAFEALAEGLQEPGVAVCGGPNLGPAGQGPLQQAFSAVLAHWFGSASVRARYASLGEPRLAGEKELILCNLLVKREAFMASGGFSETLYPNEENEWLNRMADQGYKAFYTPLGIVRRPRRASLPAFVWQAFRYGQGRIQQTFANPHAGDAIHSVPGLFLIYLLGLPLQAIWPPYSLPLLAYLILDAFASVQVLASTRDLALAASCSVFFLLRHLGYGAGWLWGLAHLGRCTTPNTEPVHIEKV